MIMCEKCRECVKGTNYMKYIKYLVAALFYYAVVFVEYYYFGTVFALIVLPVLCVIKGGK